MKKNTALALVLVLGSWVSQNPAGGIVLQRTRVIYDAGKKEATLPVANRSEGLPYLLQLWVDDAQGTVRGPFIIMPPLFRLDVGNDLSLQIIKSSENTTSDKELLFFINVRAIPAKDQTTDTNNNMLTLVLKARIKLLHRPTNLVSRPYDAYKSLEYKYSNNELDIYDPSTYHIVFAGLALGKTDLMNKINYIIPGEHKRLAVFAAVGKTVQWAAINDYGGTTKTETQTLR